MELYLAGVRFGSPHDMPKSLPPGQSQAATAQENAHFAELRRAQTTAATFWWISTNPLRDLV
ncbi:hypothetical protein MUBE_13435 [Mycobacterium uberis]|uniref:Uncharacterized protein n=1 Tax=Mycobacterium uberis TaxID=2162698 RepID=A0A3E1HDX1_9MYCO|nr:hypothetical protein MUBE_13435 [Mycobacterium uberis]